MPHLFRTASPQNRYYTWFTALHTRVDLLLLGHRTEAEFDAVVEAVRAELLAVERLGNRFDPYSELSRAVRLANSIAAVPSDSPPEAPAAPLSPTLFTLLARCLHANKETGGLFDITVNSPNFHPGLIRAVELVPSPDHAGGFLRFHRANVPSLTGGMPKEWSEASILLDLSGVLKGYALERLRSLLSVQGITDALINLGGSSILSLGLNPSDIPPNHCLTTSGNATAARQHIRNPLTGRFVTGQREVSVMTANGVDGEILSITRFLLTAS